MKVITVSNGDSSYPGNFTSEELKIIKYNSKGRVLNLFSGKCRFGNIRVDFAFGNVKRDVFGFLQDNKEYFDTIIIDAPYNKSFGYKYQELGKTPMQFIIFANTRKTTILFNKIKEMKPRIIILKSWNYYCVEGYYIDKSFLCYPGGYRKSTILLIMRKKEAD